MACVKDCDASVGPPCKGNPASSSTTSLLHLNVVAKVYFGLPLLHVWALLEVLVHLYLQQPLLHMHHLHPIIHHHLPTIHLPRHHSVAMLTLTAIMLVWELRLLKGELVSSLLPLFLYSQQWRLLYPASVQPPRLSQTSVRLRCS